MPCQKYSWWANFNVLSWPACPMCNRVRIGFIAAFGSTILVASKRIRPSLVLMSPFTLLSCWVSVAVDDSFVMPLMHCLSSSSFLRG